MIGSQWSIYNKSPVLLYICALVVARLQLYNLIPNLDYSSGMFVVIRKFFHVHDDMKNKCYVEVYKKKSQRFIIKTCQCNIYPLKPHFYLEKLGYAGVYLFSLFLLQNIDCGYSLEPPRRGGSYVYPQSMF